MEQPSLVSEIKQSEELRQASSPRAPSFWVQPLKRNLESRKYKQRSGLASETGWNGGAALFVLLVLFFSGEPIELQGLEGI